MSAALPATHAKDKQGTLYRCTGKNDGSVFVVPLPKKDPETGEIISYPPVKLPHWKPAEELEFLVN